MRSIKPIVYKVDKNGCYICISHAPDGGGYPYIKRNGKMRRVVRWLWEQKNGSTYGLHLLHSCDILTCINLKHIH